uniref:Non-selective voltage-gated ion channel VDAC3 n=1 Tax=Panthera leo TaxID=9689 RepID=A0A8C8XFQ6_PANLE
MCNTPTYCDLGKAAKDVFNKGYGFGMVKIDLRTKSCSGVEFSTSGHAYTDTGKASGNLETKYKVCNYGLTFTQKWNTDNTLGTEISLENKLTLPFDNWVVKGALHDKRYLRPPPHCQHLHRHPFCPSWGL